MKQITKSFAWGVLFAVLLINKGMQAQPNLQHSIYVKKKNCIDNLFGEPFLARFIFTLPHSNGHKYITYPEYTPDSINFYSYSTVIAEINGNYDTVWTKTYNGHWDELVEHIVELPNGNILLAGYTESEDGGIVFGDKPGRHIWMLEVDTLGNFVKAKTFGSGELNDVSITSDGYILLAGNTNNNVYEFTHVVLGSSSAAWIAKYDTAFHKVWIKVMDGSGEDGWTTIKEIMPNRYIVGFQSNGTDTASVPLEIKGAGDLIVHYLDSAGNILWKHRYGGVANDAARLSAVDTNTKDVYFVSGFNEWNATGDITYASGTCWVHKIDTLGNVKGSKAYGAPLNITLPLDAKFYDNKLWIAASSVGTGGDIDPPPPGLMTSDKAWLAVVDTNTNLVGKYTFYVKEAACLFSQLFVNNGDIYINGCAAKTSPMNSHDCDTTTMNHVFELKLGLAPLGIKEATKTAEKLFDLYPNPTENTLYLNVNEHYVGNSANIVIYSIEGKTVFRKNYTSIDAKISIETKNWMPGQYVVLFSDYKNTPYQIQFTKQ